MEPLEIITENKKIVEEEEEQVVVVEESPIEQVRLTVPTTDDPTLPVWTFRMWFLGILSCIALAFANQFFQYRKEPLVITQISVQIIALPIGRFMARVLPEKKFRIPGFGSEEFSFNPGPFNMKEHVLISIFANCGSSSAYAVSILNIIKAFYRRKITFLASWLLVLTTQVLGYGWAGIMRKYVVDPAHMWWPGTLVQVSLFRTLHEKEERKKGRISRVKFFLIALACSFSYYLFPGYLFTALTSLPLVCMAFPKSVIAHQLGSGMQGLGLGAFTLDWSAVGSYLSSPLVSPFFATFNILVGYIVIVYLAIPIAYWRFDLYNAKTFPLFSNDLFTNIGNEYNVSAIVNDKFEIDMQNYQAQGPINLSMFFALSYGFGFAAIAATISHVLLFHGKEIYNKYRDSRKGKEDIHRRLMRNYKEIPNWWFHLLTIVSFAVSLVLCIFLKDQVQMPWWGLLLACAIAITFTLPISIITATTNQVPGLNIITEYIMGFILPGKPIANVCFKTYGYISMAQANTFLSDFKLGHYMKIPPRSMFLVQFIGTIIAGTVNTGVAWWLLNSVQNICQKDLLPPGSQWTCPSDHVFYDASIIWGLVGPKRMFGSLGKYSALNWFFLLGAAGPLFVWFLHKIFPKQSWIPLINLPIIFGATGNMPPATTVNFNSWLVVGITFNFFVYRYRKQWWQRYNYVLSAALDAGVAFMAVFIHVCLSKSLTWWGTGDEACPLAACPTAKGISVPGCPVF